MPKATTPRSTARRHNPLADDILSSGHLRTTSAQSGKRKSRGDEDDDAVAAAADKFIDAKASRKILQIGQDLAEEEAAERRAALGQGSEPVNKAFDFSSRFEEDGQISDDEDRFAEEQWADEDEVEDDAVCFYIPIKSGFIFSDSCRKSTRTTSTCSTSLSPVASKTRYSTRKTPTQTKTGLESTWQT